MSFLVGDRVRAIAGRVRGISKNFDVELDRVYTVSHGGRLLQFLEKPGIDGRHPQNHSAWRFELVERPGTQVQRTESQMEFKIGDVVRCIGMNSTYKYLLIVGNLYTIKSFNSHGWIQIQDYPNGDSIAGAVYAPVFFERAAFKVGDVVKCIGMRETYGNKLTVGDTYTIESLQGGEWIGVFNDPNGPGTGYEIQYFQFANYVAPVSAIESIVEKRKKIKWNKDLVQIEATKFKKRSEFSRYAYNAYHAARNLGILDDVCAHMPERSLTKKFADSSKKVFIKYENRKLYDTVESKYVNLTDIIKMPVGSFVVMDNKTKEDVTNFILIQGVTAVLHEKPEMFESIKSVLIEKDILKG